MSTGIWVRRVDEEPSPEDGARVLVDRLWPRGMRKDTARLDEWAKDVAPSAGPWAWSQHDRGKFDDSAAGTLPSWPPAARGKP